MGLIVALAGGVGAARLLRGLARLVSAKDLVIIGNTGDDVELHGLHVSPDLDIVMYTLAGVVDETKGWGISGDTFNCLHMLSKLGMETWFSLGDRDLAVHIVRTRLLRSGMTLSQITTKLCRMLNVKAKIIPMTDSTVRTKVVTDLGILDFQEYFVKRGTKDTVTDVFYEGADNAKPAPDVIESIREAERIVICPSNPILSIAPILTIPTIRDELRNTNAYITGISPIIGGKTIKGPADRIMADMRLDVSARGVADLYKDFLDHFLIDEVDAKQRLIIENLGIKVTVAQTVMKEIEDSVRLAKIVLEANKC